MSSLIFAAGLTQTANAADLYWDGDQIANNGPLTNDYAGNPDPSAGLGGILGSSYARFNSAADGSGTTVLAPVAGDNLFFGYGTSVGTEVVLRGHTTGVLGSVNIGPNDNYRFSDRTITGWSGLNLGAGGTVNVEGTSTATFDSNSLAAGSTIGVKNGTGTLVYRNGSIQTNGSWATNAGTFIVEQTHVGATNFTNTGAGKIAYRGSATPAFGQEWDLRSSSHHSPASGRGRCGQD